MDLALGDLDAQGERAKMVAAVAAPLEPIGNIPPVESEARYYEQLNGLPMVA